MTSSNDQLTATDIITSAQDQRYLVEESRLLKQLLDETQAMASYALSAGLLESVDASDQALQELAKLMDLQYSENLDEAQTLFLIASDPDKLKRLVAGHAALTKLVKPATPGSLSLLQKQEMAAKRFKWLGRTRLIQGLSITTLIAIVLLLGVLSQYDFARSDLDNGRVEAITLALVSYIGASFLLLYQANDSAVKGTYDPKYGSTYFIRVLLGIVSGVLLAEIVPLANQDLANGQGDVPKIVLALVGGFSVNVVYRILVRLSETVESLFQGDLQSTIDSQVEKNRLEQMSKSLESRQAIASRLMTLSSQLNDEDQKQEINTLITEIIKGSLKPPEPKFRQVGGDGATPPAAD